jgi:hypothetical protein
MDNGQLIDDIKQLLKAELSQTEERIVTQLRTEIKESADGLRKEMHEGFEGIADIVSSHNDQLDDHETRLTRLEQKAA